MAHTIRGANGTCCECEQRVSCGECGGTCPGIQSRTRGGIAGLVGFAEQCSPSSPPRLYRRRTYSGGNPLKAYGTSDCLGPIIGEAEPRQSGYDVYDRLTGALTVASTFEDAAVPVAPIAGACGTNPGCESSLILTRTSATITGHNTCCAVAGNWRTAAGSRSQVLTEEDKDEDARDRLLLSPAGAWGEWSGEPLAGGAAYAVWQPRTGGSIEFVYQEVEIRVASAAGVFLPGQAMRAVISVWIAPYGAPVADFRFSYDDEVGFFARPDGTMEEVKILIEPIKGYVLWARGCLIREGLS